jgi:hypothetical protein
VRVPVRIFAALALTAILLAAASWTIWASPRARGMQLALPSRILLTLVVILTLLAVTGWVYFVLPAYWD